MDRNGFAWPDHDEKLIQVFDWVKDIDYFLQFVEGRRLVVQAGGACGQWPVEFAKHFDRVITFEPHHENYHYLQKNIKDYPSINAYQYGLSTHWHKAGITVDECEKNNCGAYYLTEGDEVQCIALDSFGLTPDLVQLDVEGRELSAIVGMQETIDRCHPVIVIEEKPLPHIQDHLIARRFLENMGYKEVGAIHRDVVFKWN